MEFTQQHIRIIQQGLNEFNDARLTVDGLKGPNTLGACRQVNIISGWWPEARLLTGAIQYICEKSGIDAGPVDGWWGPQTDNGYEQLAAYFQTGTVPPAWRDETPPAETDSQWPVQTQEALEAFYGPMGENQVRLQLPYPMKLAWDPEVEITRFQCHEKVQAPMEAALQQVLDHYGMEQVRSLRLDLFGGCLNVRKMRGGDQWSTHSWGIALDIDPAHNKLRWGPDRAALAGEAYEDWWRIWETKGATSLGRCKGYDFMHLQFADVNCG